MPNRLDGARDRSTRHVGHPLLGLGSVESTNTLALSCATDPSQDGTGWLAREQTAGRGQYGRTWTAPAGSSVLISLLLFTPPELRRPPVIVAWAAVSVCELIAELTGLPATIKWPNDVLVHGKKVCGILIEQRNSGDRDRPLATVVGIGLNVTQPADVFIEAGLPDAGSLLSLSGRHFEPDDVACQLIERLDGEYDRLLKGALASLEEKWRELLGLCGRRVRVETATEKIDGDLLSLTFASVDLRLDNAGLTRLPPEMVRLIRPISSEPEA